MPKPAPPPPNPDPFYASLWNFEHKYHGPVIDWARSKYPETIPEGEFSILDLSMDAVTFSLQIADRFPADRTTILAALREGCYPPISSKVKTVQVNLSGDTFEDIENLGKFDLILIKEMLHEVKRNLLSGFLHGLTSNMKGPHSRIFILTRPKNPPIPLPDEAMTLWRKYAPTRDEIILAGAKAGYVQDSYCCSAPIQVEKKEWGNVLKGRFLPVLRDNKKCTDRIINEFVSSYQSGANLRFEEKVLIFVLRTKAEGEEVNEDGTLKGAKSELDNEKYANLDGMEI